MRRVLIGLAVTALAVLSFTGVASAARGQVTHFKSQGVFAEGFWATGDTGTYIRGGTSKEGPFVMVDQVTTDPKTGNATETIAKSDAASFTIDQSRLTSASLTASDLPGTTCTYDETGNQVGKCSNTTIDVTAAWTGEGPISRDVFNEHFKTAGFSVSTHFRGTFRNATATATVTGVPEPLGALQFADLGNTKQIDTTVCVGGSC